MDEEQEDGLSQVHKYADLLPMLENRVPRTILSQINRNEIHETLKLNLLSGYYADDLDGLIYLIHPLATTNAPILLGEGVLNEIRFQGDGVYLRRNILKPPCAYLDELTQGTEAAFQAKDLLKTSKVYGKREILNTNLFAFKEHLICANDAGRPYVIDSSSLSLSAPIGHYHQWKTSQDDEHIGLFNAQPLKGYMTTAHPAYDQDECFFVNWGMNMPQLGMQGFVDLIKWDGKQGFDRYALKMDGVYIHIDMSVHQIALTEHYVLILDTAFKTELEDIMGLSKTAVSAQKNESVIYLVPRDQLISSQGHSLDIEVKKLSIPRESAHFIADYKHSDQGNILIYLAHQCANDASEFITDEDIHPVTQEPLDPALYGMLSAATDIGVFVKYEIDPDTAQLVEESILIDPRFYGGPNLYTLAPHVDDLRYIWLLSFGIWDEMRCQRVEKAYENYAYRQIPLAELKSQPACLTMVSLQDFKIIDSFDFPAGRFPSTPTFMPRQNAVKADDGYLIVMVFSDDTSLSNGSGHEIWGFEANRLSQGPVFRLSHPQFKMNLSLHSQYFSSPPQYSHEMDMDLLGDYQDRLVQLTADQKALFEKAISMFNQKL